MYRRAQQNLKLKQNLASRLAGSKSTSTTGGGAITLAVNGVQKQHGDLADMIWNQAEIVSNLSHLFHLHPGDLIYTGTPAGVGAVVAGDVITGRIEGLGEITLTVGQPE